MQVTKKYLEPTRIKLTVVADKDLLDEVKETVLKELGRDTKLQGFRLGKAPLPLVEKYVDPSVLQSRFLESAVNRLYVTAVEQENIRPVTQPEVSITKFVPFTTLEFDAETEAVGEVKLPDYKKIKLAKPAVKIDAKDVDEVIKSLRERAAERKEVKREAKDGDEVVIDFKGVDAKTKEPISGADGTEYPLVLGSNTFIPGFEPELVGIKPGDEKTFDITFPKDYGVNALQSKKVTITVTVRKVNELVEPKLDDKFAAAVGPFKTLDELKADIKKQLQSDRETQAQRDYESELLEKIAAQADVAIPASLIEEEIDRIELDEKQNLMYRGQTWQEHLEQEGVDEKQHREKERSGAELRVKAGLVLGEVAEQEGITVTPEELEIRMQVLKGQYSDAAMQAELDKSSARREIASRLLSEKTINKLTAYASAK